jgi:ornithine racemase
MNRVYPCVEINLSKIKDNTKEIASLCSRFGISLVGVSKVFCARKSIVKAMLEGGAVMIGDSRIENLKRIEGMDCKKMLLRIPMGSTAMDVVRYCDVSLNSEIVTIKHLSKAAQALEKTHGIILMVDEGDLREGILECDVLEIVKEILDLKNIELVGLGTNLTCYGGVIPDINNLGRLAALNKNIKSIFGIDMPIISGGNSSSLYMVMNGTIPAEINQLRIGEGILLGRETAFGNPIPNCSNDCFMLKGEIIEIKNKPSVPSGRIGTDAFGETPLFEDRGIIKRAIVALGRQDIKIDGLKLMDKDITILGASSDHLILDVTLSKMDYEVGSIVDFNMDYGCLLMSMTSPYVKKYYV